MSNAKNLSEWLSGDLNTIIRKKNWVNLVLKVPAPNFTKVQFLHDHGVPIDIYRNETKIDSAKTLSEFNKLFNEILRDKTFL